VRGCALVGGVNLADWVEWVRDPGCAGSDPDAKVIVVEYRDGLARFGVDHLQAVLAAQGRRIVVDPGETTDDLVRAVIAVLTSMSARFCERGGAGNGALRAARTGPGVDRLWGGRPGRPCWSLRLPTWWSSWWWAES
jgi:putative resolvase